MPLVNDVYPPRRLSQILIPGALAGLAALSLLAACEPAPPAQPEPVPVVSAITHPSAHSCDVVSLETVQEYTRSVWVWC